MITEWEILREKILERDEHKCVVCGSSEELSVHHLVPKSAGGSDSLSNLITVCVVCHNLKFHKDLYRDWQASLGLCRRFVRFCSDKIKTLKKLLGLELTAMDIHFLLNCVFGHEKFKLGQKKAIETILAKRDTLLILPTAGGKSLCYTLPAVAAPNSTIIVSPLISLMEDQHTKAAEKLIPATFFSSLLEYDEKRKRRDMMQDGAFKLVFVAPERFTKDPKFMPSVRNVNVDMFVVDEAHCVDLWGHNFRLDYMKLKDIAKAIGRPPILALTATATPTTRKEIKRRLGMRFPKILVYGFDRPNISFNVAHCASKKEKDDKLLSLVKMLHGPGIVYTSTTPTCDELLTALSEAGARVGKYHGKMTGRSASQDFFMNDKIDVLVATKAFGMGIDKSNVRYIIHYEIPGSIDDYYQQVGRCGRDHKPATGVLLYCPEDETIQKRFIESASPTERELEETWEYVRETYSERGITIIKRRDFPYPEKVDICLKLYESVGGLKYFSDRNASWMEESFEIEVLRDEPYKKLRITLKHLKERNKRAFHELCEMIKFVKSRRCRRKIILSYFGSKEKSGGIRVFLKRIFCMGGKEKEKLPCCSNCQTFGFSRWKRFVSMLSGVREHKLSLHPSLVKFK